MEEDYYFQIDDYADRRLFVLVIYDIVDNKRRTKFARFLLGYGFRVQKSAFEAMIPPAKYEKLLREIPRYVGEEDSVRLYKIIGKGQVKTWGNYESQEVEDIILV